MNTSSYNPLSYSMASQELSLAYMVLPPSILDWFDIVKVYEQITDTTGKEVFVGIIHIYLDESDNRTSETAHLRPNGFTEETKVSDFPIRDRKVLLHIRRRRWLDSDGKKRNNQHLSTCRARHPLLSGVCGFFKRGSWIRPR